MISDKLKSTLPHFVLLEVNKKELDDFLKPHELGKLSDRCVANLNELNSTNFGLSKHENINRQTGKQNVCYSCKGADHYANDPICPNFNSATKSSKAIEQSNDNQTRGANRSGHNLSKTVSAAAANLSNYSTAKPKGSCTFCGKSNHSFLQCFERGKGLKCKYCSLSNHASHMCRYKDRQVNFVRTSSVTNDFNNYPNKRIERSYFGDKFAGANPNSCLQAVSGIDCDDNLDVVKLLELSDKHKQTFTTDVNTGENVKIQQINYVHTPVKGYSDHTVSEHIIPSGLIDLKIGRTWTKCLVDFGAEISVIRKDAVEKELLNQSINTTVNLHSAFGQKVTAQLVNLPCSTKQNDSGVETNSLYLTAAVTDQLTTHSLLTPDDYNDMMNSTDANSFISQVSLLNHSKLLAPHEIVNLNNNVVNDPSDISSALEVRIINTDDKHNRTQQSKSDNSKANTNSSISLNNANSIAKSDCPLGSAESLMKLHDEMIILQKDDPTIESCFKMAKTGKSEFFVRDSDRLLYRKTNKFGFQVYQLILPESKRAEVLRLAHDSVFEGGHFAFKKTLQRIQTCFYWPTMRKDIETYTQSCKHCQLHKRVTVHDRVPIKAVMRPQEFGDTLSIDLIGPLEPASSKGHKYILCVIDQTTKWPEIACLRSATAKETCNALLQIFARIGLPRVIVCDNGTNFVSQLNKQFFETLGVEVRTSSPFHPEGNSIVERFNHTLKNLLHIVVNSDKPREWDQKVEYLLWCYRSIPHTTLGVSPYQMVYGKLPRGPLSVLRDNMTGVQTGLLPVTNSVKEYCENLVKNLEIGHNIASKQCDTVQRQYVSHYNLRCKNKSFNPGDQVIVLFPDSTNKLVSKFQGPAIVHTKLNDYAYMVAMPNGAVRRLHANKLRLYIPRVASVGVVFDDEEDFGNLPYYPASNEIGQAIDWKTVDLSHLEPDQQDQIRDLILKHKKVFSDKPGRCTVGCHCIELENGAKPKRKTPYRIPEKLKVEIDRQIDELLEDGLISESTSAWAHPIVCVAKPDNSIRLCVNYVDVNASTIPDKTPMPRIDDLVQEVGKSNFISTLDCTSGYWQIEVHPESRDKTAFITHRGLFHWNVLSFGLKNAGATFQKTINTILKDYRKYACAYIDDTSVHSNTWEEHLVHLDAVLTAFENSGMTLKLSKCKFGKSTVKYVGHIIGSGRIAADQSKIAAILDMPVPTTKKLWRSFIGMVNYYRAYIPNMAELLIPLTELTKSKMPNKVRITEAVTRAFEEFKEILCSPKVLRTARYDRDFIIQCDASFYAVGACLAQLDNDGSEHPIAFASSKLSDVQRRWSTIEKEGYAIIFALRKFDAMVFGQKHRDRL